MERSLIIQGVLSSSDLDQAYNPHYSPLSSARTDTADIWLSHDIWLDLILYRGVNAGK